jgi:hypothetical protein
LDNSLTLRTGRIWAWRKYKKETNVDVVIKIVNEKQLGEPGVGTRNSSKIIYLPQ